MKVLILVDLQNDFIDGVLGTKEAQAIVPKVVNMIKDYSATYGNEMLVFLTKDTHMDNYLDTDEGKHLPVEHTIIGTRGWSINDKISEAIKMSNFAVYSSHEITQGRILKSAFGSLELAKALVAVDANYDIDEIIIAGVCTDKCVISNAIIAKAACPNIPVTVRADCCAGVSPEAHNAALEAMKLCFINVSN